MLKITEAELEGVAGRCLEAYLEAGTMELSLDRLGWRVGVSKRRLVHYFGSREALEAQALALFETQLREQLAASAFPTNLTLAQAVLALWERMTAAAFRGSLRLILELFHRACNGEGKGQERARRFYDGQQELWSGLLAGHLNDRPRVEALLQLLPGAALGLLITGDAAPGRAALERIAVA